MKMISGIYWDKGGRRQNQDSVLLEQVVTKKGRVFLGAVSDGIGGLSEGELASGFILERLQQLFYGELLPLLVKGKGWRRIENCLFRGLFSIGRAFLTYGNSRDVKLGATLSLLLIWNGHYLTLHLGDSRIYLLKKDRTWGNSLEKMGKEEKGIKLLTKDHSEKEGFLTRCLGSFSYQPPDVRGGRIRKNTGFLLCTDGFFRIPGTRRLREGLPPGEMESEEQIERRLRALAAFGAGRGEKDNASAVYVVCR